MRFWAFLGTAIAGATLSLNASAYCRTSTEGLEDGCRPAGTNCCTLGKPIYWKNACIGFSMHVLGTKFISLGSASRTVSQAFSIWASASCPGGEGSSRVSIDVRQLPQVECGDVATELKLPNQNVIVFRDVVWNHKDPDNVLALTTVNFDKNTGEIRGADLEYNTANIPMECPQDRTSPEASCFDGPPSAKSYDFASITTHEVGHFLGMAHSNNPNATMAPQYTGGNFSLRTLTADDIAGICSVYPPDGTRRTGNGTDTGSVPEGPCDPTPLNGFSSVCAQQSCFIFCCSAAAAGMRSPEGAAVGLGALGLLIATAHLRGRRKSS